jgi:hypothetical protein
MEEHIKTWLRDYQLIFGKKVLFDVELKNKDIAILDILRRFKDDSNN